MLSVDSNKLFRNKDIKELRFRKKGVIRNTEGFFNLLCLISPFSVRVKILLKDFWKNRLDTDNALPPHLAKIFQDYCEELF